MATFAINNSIRLTGTFRDLVNSIQANLLTALEAYFRIILISNIGVTAKCNAIRA